MRFQREFDKYKNVGGSVPAIVFMILIKSYFGIQLRLVSIREDGHI